jgi:hypothetical protein
MMSGISDQAALSRFADLRIAGFVPKPFAPDQLAQAVAMVRHGPGGWVGKDRRDSGNGGGYPGPERRSATEQAERTRL